MGIGGRWHLADKVARFFVSCIERTIGREPLDRLARSRVDNAEDFG